MPGYRIVAPIAVFLFLGLLWEWSANLLTSLAFTLPAPSMIGSALMANYGRFLFHSAVTLKEMLWGIGIAFAFSFPLAWAMYLKRYARDIFQPMFVLLQCVPMFTLAPIMVAWFGWSFISIVVPTALMIFYPLTTNIYQGLRTTPQELIDYFRVHGATSMQLFTKLQLPWALPHLFSGLRIVAAISGIGAIAGEWAGAQQGLGLLMLESRRSADLETSFAALFCLTLLGLGLFFFIVFLECAFLERKARPARITLVTGALASCALFLCSMQENQTKAAAATTMVLDWLPNPNHVPLYAGIQKQIFKKHGIDLAIMKVPDPSSPISYVTSGQADLALFYGPDTIRAIHFGAEIDPIAILIEKPLIGLIYRDGEGIDIPEDLSGKTIGYCLEGSSIAFLEAILRTNHIHPSEKRNVSFDLVSTLGTNKVDAIYGAYWNIECEYLRGKGIETGYFTGEELGVPSYPELVVVAKKRSVIDIEQFQEALQESIDFCRENPEEAFALYLHCNPDKGDKVVECEKNAWVATEPLLAHRQVIDRIEWDLFKEWLFSRKIIQ